MLTVVSCAEVLSRFEAFSEVARILEITLEVRFDPQHRLLQILRPLVLFRHTPTNNLEKFFTREKLFI